MQPDIEKLIAAAEFFTEPVFPEDGYLEWLLRGMLARLGDDGRMACIVHRTPDVVVLRGNLWLLAAFDLRENEPGRRAFAGYFSTGLIPGLDRESGADGIPIKVGVARLQIGNPDAQSEVTGYEICELRNVGWGARHWRSKA